VSLELPIFILKKGFGYVYHLLDENNNILYIGSTKLIYNRIEQHIKSKKNIRKVIFWPFPWDQLLVEEANQIIKYKPPLNLVLHSNGNWMSKETFQKKNPIVKGKSVKIRHLMSKHGFYKEMGCLTLEQWEIIAKELEVK
jgi:hypothetical protein